MKIKLTFKGPIVVTGMTTAAPIPMGHAVSFETAVARGDAMTLDDIKRFWDMEQAFNELTAGRLHIELIPEPGE